MYYLVSTPFSSKTESLQTKLNHANPKIGVLYGLIAQAWLYLSQLTDLFRQASNLRVGDTARVLMGHVVHQRVHLSGQVPLKQCTG